MLHIRVCVKFFLLNVTVHIHVVYRHAAAQKEPAACLRGLQIGLETRVLGFGLELCRGTRSQGNCSTVLALIM